MDSVRQPRGIKKKIGDIVTEDGAATITFALMFAWGITSLWYWYKKKKKEEKK